MGKIQILPFLGHDLFQKGYPLFMVIYTGLLASNIFPKLVEYVGGWKRFRVENEHDQETAVEGFDPSGVMIVKKGSGNLHLTSLAYYMHGCHLRGMLQFYALLFLRCLSRAIWARARWTYR